jgi:hypothetical protein
LEDFNYLLSPKDYEAIYKVMRNNDIEAYLALSEDWSAQCTTASDIPIAERRAKYQVAQLLKKFMFDTSKEQRIAKAKEKFYLAEANCALYNSELYSELQASSDIWNSQLLTYARSFLSKLLGPTTVGQHEALLLSSRHGPGANLDTRNGLVSSYDKYGNWPYSCTKDALGYAMFAIAQDKRWIGALLDSYRDKLGIPQHFPIRMSEFWSAVLHPVEANKVTFVPKNAQTERTIAIEPAMNLYLQLGVDGYVRKRLKRFYVDLDDQEHNQYLAMCGSIREHTKSFATIDLSMASDSLSLKLCEILLPHDWYTYLCRLRSPYGKLGHEIISYEKISSMGNGYTFAIESAVFTAIIYAVMKINRIPFLPENFSVFGDDLIVPTRIYYQVVEALRLCGFAINLDKTYNYGPYKESCGTEWHNGRPIRPVYLKETPTTVPQLFLDLNRFKRTLDLRFGITQSKLEEKLLSWIPDIFKDIVGPFSDQEFDAYRHVPEPVSKAGFSKTFLYKYFRFVVKPISKPGRSFLFRKLMHDLRGTPIKNIFDKVGKSSRFTVYKRNSLTVSISSSKTSNWSCEYREISPLR